MPDDGVIEEEFPRVELCGEQQAEPVFSHYAYGDPQPVYMRFYDSDGEPVTRDLAALVYVSCQREKGHPGQHMTAGRSRWPE